MLTKIFPTWARQYIGLPFKEHGRTKEGVDCWGLLRLVWREQFGLIVPSYVDEYTCTTNPKELGPVLTKHVEEEWIEINDKQGQLGDGLLFRIYRQPMHVGMVIAKGYMLHIEIGVNSVIERYDKRIWCNRHLGTFRHFTLFNDFATKEAG